MERRDQISIFAKDDYPIESHEEVSPRIQRKKYRYLAAFLKSQENRFETGRIHSHDCVNAVEILEDKLQNNMPPTAARALISVKSRRRSRFPWRRMHPSPSMRSIKMNIFITGLITLDDAGRLVCLSGLGGGKTFSGTVK